MNKLYHRDRLKKLTVAILLLSLFCSLCACGETALPAPTDAPAPPTDTVPTAAPEPISAPTPDPVPEPTPEPELLEIDAQTLPASLSDFLCRFDYGYSDRMDGREFDSRNCVDVRANLLAQLVCSAPCVDYSLYPVVQPVYHWADGTADPHEKTDGAGYYAEFDPEAVRWIAQEIFRLSDGDYAAVLARCINSGTFYLDKNADGEERYFIPVLYLTAPNALVLYGSARSDGTRYEIEYDYLLRPYTYIGSYSAELELREIGGKEYWTLLRHTEDTAVYEPEEAPELFAQLSEPFYLSGADGWQTELSIEPDGSFRGSYRYLELLDNGEDCDQILHYADFAGRFVNPTKTGPYTYSVELAELYDPDEVLDYIVEEEDGWRILYRHEEAYGLQNSTLFCLYAPGAPLYKLPSAFRAWYGATVPLNEYTLALPGWGLMNVSEGYGFAS